MTTIDDRTKAQPALYMVAETICTYDKTDGFCHPRNCQSCPRCWGAARRLLKDTGLSARAVTWVLMHKERVESEAKENGNG